MASNPRDALAKSDSKDAAADPTKRNLAMAVLGAFGGAALLESCASPAGGVNGPEPLGHVVQAASGGGTLEFADTASELRTIMGGAVGWVAVLNGHTQIGDGGGGVFYWSTTSAQDNGGTVFNSGAGDSEGWRRIYSGPLDVRWFGILPNDASFKTTNTTRINALFAMYVGNSGISIHAPRGEYHFDGQITINGIGGAHIFGDGDGATIFRYNADYQAIPFIYFLRNSSCVVERITFYAAPIGSSGGVAGGTSSVDYALQMTTDTSGVNAQNTFRNCRFQGGKIAGLLVGSPSGHDTNNDANAFERCRFMFNDGAGIIVSDFNTANTRFTHCSIEENGEWGVQLRIFPRNTVFDQCSVANSGMLDSTKKAHYRIESSFGRENVYILSSVFELQNDGAILSTAAGTGGADVPSGGVIIRGLYASNNNANDTLIFDCQGAMNYVLEDVRVSGNGVDGHCVFSPALVTGAVAGEHVLYTRNVTLVGGATLDVRTTGVNAMRWDGSGVITLTDFADSNPGAPTRVVISNADVASGAAIDGIKVVPDFGAQALAAGSESVAGSGLFLTAATAKVKIASYTGGDNFAGLYIGITPGSEDNRNWAFLSNGGSTLINAPDASGEVTIYCGFGGTIARFKGTDGAPQFRLGNGSYADPQTYTVTSHTDSRSLDEATATLADLVKVVGTMIKDFQAFGWKKGTTS